MRCVETLRGAVRNIVQAGKYERVTQYGIYMPKDGLMNNVTPGEREIPVPVAAWVGTIIVSLVSLLNLAFLLYWSFGRGVDPNRRNFSRAGLIVIGAVTALAVLLFFYMLLSIDPNERIKAFLMVE